MPRSTDGAVGAPLHAGSQTFRWYFDMKRMGGTGLEPVTPSLRTSDPQLVELVLSQLS